MRGWFVTPAHNPTKLLAGPYGSRAEAASQCVIMTSELTKAAAAQALTINVTSYYVPRLVDITILDSMVPAKPLDSACVTADSTKPQHVPKHADPQRAMYIKLTNRMIHFTKEQLLEVAAILEIEIRNPKASQLEILNVIMLALRE